MQINMLKAISKNWSVVRKVGINTASLKGQRVSLCCEGECIGVYLFALT